MDQEEAYINGMKLQYCLCEYSLYGMLKKGTGVVNVESGGHYICHLNICSKSRYCALVTVS